MHITFSKAKTPENYPTKKYTLKTNFKKTEGIQTYNNLHKYTCSNIKANYLPSFSGGYTKIGKTTLIDKNTGEKVGADIKRSQIGDFASYKLMLKRKEAGYLDMDFDAIFPENIYMLTSHFNNNIPRVLHIRSIMGDEYYGIGTELIKTAILESYNKGYSGDLWLTTEKGYAKTLSRHRSDQNPIPFYYKMGFASPDNDFDSYIKECIKNSKFSKLPPSALLLLTPEARDAWLAELLKSSVTKNGYDIA